MIKPPKENRCTSLEQLILFFLYDNPRGNHTTVSIQHSLKGQLGDLDELAEGMKMVRLDTDMEGNHDPISKSYNERSIADMQAGIELLIVKKLIRGKRDGTPGNITYCAIRLTREGERAAIVLREIANRDLAERLKSSRERVRAMGQLTIG